jgi:hypothetical protein
MNTIAKVHRFAVKCSKSVKRRILPRGEMMTLFHAIQNNRNDHTFLKELLIYIEQRESPFWTVHYNKEMQLILYLRWILEPDFVLRQTHRQNLKKILDLDHELGRKIAKELH